MLHPNKKETTDMIHWTTCSADLSLCLGVWFLCECETSIACCFTEVVSTAGHCESAEVYCRRVFSAPYGFDGSV